MALKIDDRTLRSHLTHCKFSSEAKPGARVGDLYEVYGQTMKSVVWRNELFAMLENLRRREANRQVDKGFSGLVLGSERQLLEVLDCVHRLRVEFTIAVSQPGLSAKAVGGDQLRLLPSTNSYVRQITSARFEVYCSE